jgi:hypothetical protein
LLVGLFLSGLLKKYAVSDEIGHDIAIVDYYSASVGHDIAIVIDNIADVGLYNSVVDIDNAIVGHDIIITALYFVDVGCQYGRMDRSIVPQVILVVFNSVLFQEQDILIFECYLFVM